MQSPEDLDFLSLDDLFKEARTHVKAARKEAARRKEEAPASLNPQLRYTNPANWLAGRVVALVHRETNSLIGNFIEWLHISEEGTRKLIQTEAPVQVAGIEYVSGDHWLPASHRPAPLVPDSHSLVWKFHTRLGPLHAQAPSIELRLRIGWHQLVRVELVEPTIFALDAGGLLCLPMDANILEVLAPDTRTQILLHLAEVFPDGY